MSLSGAAAASEGDDTGETAAETRRGKGPLLESYLARHRTGAAVEPYLGALFGTAGLAGVVGVLGFAGGKPSAKEWGEAGAASIAMVGGFGSYLLPEDYQSQAALTSMMFTSGALWFAVVRSSRTGPATMAASSFTGTAVFLNGGLLVADMLIERPVSERSLARHHAALARGDASALRIAEAERDFRRTNRPIPLWVHPIPFLFAGVGSAVGAAQPGLNDRDQAVSIAIAVMDTLLIPMPYVIGMLGRRPYDDYASESLRFAPEGPNGSLGATVAGRF